MRAWPSSALILNRSSLGLLLASSLFACTFDTGGPRVDRVDGGPGPGDPDAAVDAFVTGDDGGGVATTVKHDTALDFGAPTARLESAVVEGWGAIGAAPAPTGALLARGLVGRRFTTADTDPNTTNDSWENASRGPHRGSSLMGPSPTGLFDGKPVLNDMPVEQWTMTLEGEVWLEAGDHQWELTVDDSGFVELAAPGSSAYTRILAAPVNTPRTAPYTATTTGWHPIHIAMTNGVGPGQVNVRHRGPRDTAFTAIPPFRLRPPPGTQSPTGGLLGVGFDNTLMLSSRGSVPHIAEGLSVNELNAHTFGILTRTTNWAGRWTGQVRIDTAGNHRFRVTSDDGQRLYIDGQRVIDAYSSSAGGGSDVVRESPEINLEVGWHDIAVDLRQGEGPALLRLEMQTPGQAYTLLPSTRTRPTLLRSPQVTGNISVLRDNIEEDATGVIYDLAVDGVSDGAVETVDLFVNVDHEAHRDLEVSIFAPGSTEREVILVAGSLTSTGARDLAIPNIQIFQNKAPAGTWKVAVRDRVDNSDTGAALAAALVIHYKGGELPMQKRGTYESEVLNLGKVVGFDAVSWVQRTPAGSSIAVRARTCATADGCAVESWSEPLTSGKIPPLQTARAFFQYQVELVSDGVAAPSLESLEIAYRK